MKIKNSMGTIHINNDVFAQLSGYAATNCFGVKGMATRTVGDGLVHLLRPESMSRGVKVMFSKEGLIIDLHIIIDHGVNIQALCASIKEGVIYTVQRLTSIKVKAVNVFVDSIRSTL